MRHALPHVPIMGFCTCLIYVRFWGRISDLRTHVSMAYPLQIRDVTTEQPLSPNRLSVAAELL